MGGDEIIVNVGSLFYKVTNLGTMHLSSTRAALSIILQMGSDFKLSSLKVGTLFS